MSMEQWISSLQQSNFQILCMGELHENSTRNFLSNEFFSNFSIDVLLLEATPKELNRLMNRLEGGRDYFPLLGADIMSLLRTAVKRNPDVKIFGIEETYKQTENHHGQLNSRDQFIAQNFWDAFQTGSRHIILFGALHCTNEPAWLFHNLCNQTSHALKDKMINVLVVGEHQNGPVEAFVYFLDRIGIKMKHFVIPDTRSLPNLIYKCFPLLDHQILGKYRSLIIFRT